MLVAFLYVDNLLFMETSQNIFHEFKLAAFKEFEMINCRIAGFFLGNEIDQDGIFIFIKESCQKKNLLKFRTFHCKAARTLMVISLNLTEEGERI